MLVTSYSFPRDFMNHELRKTCDELRKSGADGAVLASIENVTYVTNVEQPVHVGALAATTVAPWLAIVSTRDEGGIVLAPAGKVGGVAAGRRWIQAGFARRANGPTRDECRPHDAAFARL